MPAQTAVFVLVGVAGDVFFYGRWSHWTPEEGAVFATGLSCVVVGIYLFTPTKPVASAVLNDP